MVKIFWAILLTLNLAIGSTITIKTKKDVEYIYLEGVSSLKKVPFFDDMFFVIQVNNHITDVYKKNTKLISDINIIKTDESTKIVFELSSSKIKNKIEKTKNGYRIVFFKNSFPSLSKVKQKHIDTKKQQNKVYSSAKKEKEKKKIISKKNNNTYEDYPEIILKIKPKNEKKLEKIKPTFTRLTKDPLYHIIIKSLAEDDKFNIFRKKIIVIDAGHGGKDPGAVANGLVEKHITLKIAKKIKKYLEKDGRFKVYLTRRYDKSIGLYERSVFAVKKKADLFISIHCNADETGYGQGTYVYTLSNKGAKLKLTRLVAARENRAVLKQVRVSNNWYVNKIVAELAINTTMTEGLNFAKVLRKKLRYITNFKDIDSANFAVLKTPGIPSVLIETAYLTNKKDAKLLKDPIFLENFSASVYTAIVDYFFNYQRAVYNK